MDGALLGACRRHIGGVEILAVLGHRAAHALPVQVQIAVSADADLGTVGAGQVIVAGELPVGVQNRVVHAHPDHGVGALLQGVTGTHRRGPVLGKHICGGHPVAPGIALAGGGGLSAAVQTVGHLGQTAGLGKPCVLQAVMDRGHHLLEHLGRRVTGGRHPGRGLKAHPHRGGVVGGVAHKPAVVLGVGGTGLAGHRHAADPGLIAASAADHVGEHIVHIVGGGVLDGLLLLPGVVQEHIAVGVLHPGEGAGLPVHAVVGEGGKGGGHIPGADAQGQAAQGQGGDGDVADRLAADGLLADQGQVEPLGPVLKALGGGHQVGQHPHRHGVEGVLHRRVDGDLSPVAPIHVHRPGASAQHLIGVVGDHRDGADQPHIHGGGVHGQGLDGGAGLALGVGSQVEAPVELLLPDAAHDGGNVSRLVVNDGDGGLEPLAAGGVVVQIRLVLVNGFRLGLDIWVNAGVNPQAALGEHQADHLVRVVILLLQGLPHIGNHRLLVPGVDLSGLRGIIFGLAGVDAHKVKLLGHRLVVLLLGDIALVQHLVEDQLLAVLVPLHRGPHLPLAVGHPGQGVGAVLGGVVGDADEAGALGQGQLGHRLAEVLLRRGPHALTAGAQGADVQVVQQNGVLAVGLVHIQGGEDLLDLSGHRHLVLLGEVFDGLLGDGGAALDVAAGEHAHHRLGSAPPVHAVVGVEPAVLDGHRRVLQILGDLLKIHPLRAGVAEDLAQLLVLPAVILVVHDAVLVEGEVVHVHLGLGQDVVADVDRREAAHNGPRSDGHQQNGTDHPQSRAPRAPLPALFAPAGLRGAAAGTAAAAGPGFVLGRIGRIISFRHRIYLRT